MWCNFTFVRVKLTYFKNDYDDDDPDKFKKLDPRRAKLAGKNLFSFLIDTSIHIYIKNVKNKFKIL